MNYSSVLIITYGRSGSTLLQGLLNSIPGYLIRGENYNFCKGLFDAYLSLSNTRKTQAGPDKPDTRLPVSPWFGGCEISVDQFLADVQALVRHQLVPKRMESAVRCYGFKEIRYLHLLEQENDPDGEYFVQYLSFLESIFPNPAFITLRRDHDQVAKSQALNSGWWGKQDPTVAKARLQFFESIMSNQELQRDNMFSISYKDLNERTSRIEKLFDFLGEPIDKELVEKTLSKKHSY